MEEPKRTDYREANGYVRDVPGVFPAPRSVSVAVFDPSGKTIRASTEVALSAGETRYALPVLEVAGVYLGRVG